MGNEDKDLDPVNRKGGKFKKGQTGNAKGARKSKTSPVTASYCATHYEQLCKIAMSGLLETRDLITLFKFEHDSLYGKPTERIEHTGADGAPLHGVDKPQGESREVWLLRRPVIASS